MNRVRIRERTSVIVEETFESTRIIEVRLATVAALLEVFETSRVGDERAVVDAARTRVHRSGRGDAYCGQAGGKEEGLAEEHDGSRLRDLF